MNKLVVIIVVHLIITIMMNSIGVWVDTHMVLAR